MGKPQLQNCPVCKRLSLRHDVKGKYWECLNNSCPDYLVSLSEVSIDRYNREIAEDKKSLKDLDGKESRVWFNDNYYDTKKKRWVSAGKAIRTFHLQWWHIVLAFVILSIIVTLILNYLHPGSSSSFFIW